MTNHTNQNPASLIPSSVLSILEIFAAANTVDECKIQVVRRTRNDEQQNDKFRESLSDAIGRQIACCLHSEWHSEPNEENKVIAIRTANLIEAIKPGKYVLIKECGQYLLNMYLVSKKWLKLQGEASLRPERETYIKCWAIWYDNEAQRRVGEFDIADEIHGISYELAGLLKDEIHAHYLEASKTLKFPENTVMIEFIATNFSQDLLSNAGGEIFSEGELNITPINYTTTDDGKTFIVSEYVTANQETKTTDQEAEVTRKGIAINDGIVYIDGVQIKLPLTALEFKLLSILYRHCGQLVSRAVAVDSVWGGKHDTNYDATKRDAAKRDERLYKLMARLQKKLGQKNQFIETHHGRGYILKAQI